jgi:acyl-CoA reductase-like NAD-dependent aldehyde dehydrogenase
MSDSPAPLDPQTLDSIVREILARMGHEADAAGPAPAALSGDGGRSTSTTSEAPGLYCDLDSAVSAAWRAFEELQELPLEKRRSLLEAMRTAARAAAPELARLAVEETGLGRVDDKVAKNLLVADKTPGLEILESWAVSGDHGLTLQELAPWGVIGAIAPCTNPSETIICNGIGMVAAGNAVVFCPHPAAKGVSARIIVLLNRAIAAAGGPASLLCAFSDPSVELAQRLMRHPRVPLLVVTGGPAVVREAMSTGKRVIAAGPGNPPTVVDETADLERTARDLVMGASLDNNIVCTDEKEAFVVSSVLDPLKSALEAQGAHEIHGAQIERVLALILANRNRVAEVRKEWVGKDARRILEAIGVRPRRAVRLITAEVDRDHPLVWTEQLLPVYPLVRVKSWEEGITLALAAEQGCRHSASMFSRNIERLSIMARRANTSIFVKNGPTCAGLGLGGEGYTSFTIAGRTGEGLTTARNFCRVRRCTLVDSFRIV